MKPSVADGFHFQAPVKTDCFSNRKSGDSKTHVKFMTPILQPEAKSLVTDYPFPPPPEFSQQPLTSSSHIIDNISLPSLPLPPIATQPSVVHPSKPHVSKSSLFCPTFFTGAEAQNKCREWMRSLTLWFEFNDITDNSVKLSTLALLLKDRAGTWYRSLKPEDASDFDKVSQLFLERWNMAEKPWSSFASLWSLRQEQGQSASDFIADLLVKSETLAIDKKSIFYIALNGLRPQTRQAVLIKGANDIDELLKAANLVELSTEVDFSGNGEIIKTLAEMQLELKRIQAPAVLPVRNERRVQFDLPPERTTQGSQEVNYLPFNEPLQSEHICYTNAAPITSDAAYQSTYQHAPSTFSQTSRIPRNNDVYNTPHAPSPFQGSRFPRSNVAYTTPHASRVINGSRPYQQSFTQVPPNQQRYSSPYFPRTPRFARASAFVPRFDGTRAPFNDSSSFGNRPPCLNCGAHHKFGSCPAFGLFCGICSKPNHISRCCRSGYSAPH